MDRHTTAGELVRAAPPLSISTLSILGVPLQDWVIILTFVYTAFQLYFLLRDKWWRQRGK